MDKVVAIIVFDLMMVIVYTLIVCVPVWLLWNLLMPDIFNLPRIGFWQACGLIVLSNLLVRSHTTTKVKESK